MTSGHSSRIVWFTGLSGSGKSTICVALAAVLRKMGFRVQILDGDEVRKGLCSDLGFTIEDRTENIRRVAHAAALLAHSGDIVLVSVITPLKAFRESVRGILPEVVEVFVDAPLAVCEQRDPKGLYKRARAGQLLNFTGIDSPFELPSQFDVHCRTDQESIEASVSRVLLALLTKEGKVLEPTPEARTSVTVAFDGLLSSHYEWKAITLLAPPGLEIIAALREFTFKGWKLMIRSTKEESLIRNYLTESNVPFEEIHPNAEYSVGGIRNGSATAYWNDRSVSDSGAVVQNEK